MAVPRVVSNESPELEQAVQAGEKLILSPGPGTVEDDCHRATFRLLERLPRFTPVLGVCLGHQIIATALGAQLRKGDAPEIGFAPIKRVDKHDFFSMWDKQLTVLHWHNDVVGLPAEGQLLSRSSSTKVQAFRLGSGLGMQFHLEVCGSLLDEWLDEPSMVKDLKAAGGSKSQLREQFAQYDQLLQPLAEQVFSGFAARCNSYAQTLNK